MYLLGMGLLMRKRSLEYRPPVRIRLRRLKALPFVVVLATSLSGLTGCGLFLPPESPPSSPSTDAESPTESGPLTTPALPSPLPTNDAAACQVAAELALSNPEQALELIEQIRGTPAPQESEGRTNCTEARNYALQKLAESRKASVSATPTPTPTPSPSPMPVEVKEDWDAYTGSWVAPWQTLALTFIGFVLGWLILARLLALLPNPLMPPKSLDWRHRSKSIRRASFWVGLFLIVVPTLRFITLLVESRRRPPHTVAVDSQQLLGLIVAALIGSALFGIWIASRPRLVIVVRNQDGTLQESGTSYIIAVLNELGATPPRGVEIPRGADATGLADATISAELSNKILASFLKIAQAIFGGTPWRIVVDSVSDNDMAVAITRNGWGAKATTIRRSNGVLFPIWPEKTEESKEKSTAGTPPDDEIPGQELHAMAAAFIVSTLAQHYQGYEGLCGATDWRSIGLQYLATTDYAGQEEVQKKMLARAVELDPGNLLASASLMNLLYRHEPAYTIGLQRYESWLQLESEEIEKMNSYVTKRGRAKSACIELFEGHRGLLYRLRLTQLSVGINRMADSPQGIPNETSMGYRRIADGLISHLYHTNPQTLELVKRLRPLVALIYFDLHGPIERIFLEPTLEPWLEWRKEALLSSSPAISYSVACSYARLDGNDQEIESRLAVAALDPDLAKWMKIDPELKKYNERQLRERELGTQNYR